MGHAAAAAFLLRVIYPRVGFEGRRTILRWWSTKLLRILNATTRVEGAVPAAHERGTMIAANHVSWLDIFLISSVRPTRFIAKGEIRDWPIAGWIADRAGTLFIRRDQWRETTRINEKVHAALAQGDCVGLFPEGFTTEGDTLLKFHSALLEPAVANSAHVHPAAIRYEHPDGTLAREISFMGDRTLFESISLIIGQRAFTASIAFAAPIETPGATRREVTRGAEDRIASLLGLSPAGRPPGVPSGRPGAPR